MLFLSGQVGGGLLWPGGWCRLTIALGGALASIDFVLTARLDGGNLPMLCLSHGVITATGIGFAYVVVLSTVQAWFLRQRAHLPTGARWWAFVAPPVVNLLATPSGSHLSRLAGSGTLLPGGQMGICDSAGRGLPAAIPRLPWPGMES